VPVPPPPEPLFLHTRPDPSFATVHRPAPGSATGTAVLLCPPFGWEEICAYRPLRHWAQALAADGHAALRLSYPSTGDSGGSPRDPGRLGAWVAAVADAAAWLRADACASRTVAVGLGLGGLLACLAAEAGAELDEFVLWGTPARGRALVRSLRAFSAIERSQCYEGLGEPPEAEPPGELEAGGFVLSADTVAALEPVDLGALELPARGPGRRALLLERDGLAPDAALREAFERGGFAVADAAGDGFADATSHPQTARAPVAVIARVGRWLAEAPPAASGAGRRAPAASAAVAAASAEIAVGDGAVRETAISLTVPTGALAGVLAEPLEAPSHGLCAVLLNAGAVRRIGPGRMWVEATRRWAAIGVPALRLDLDAIGDSDGDERPYADDGALYAPTFVPNLLLGLDQLQRRGTAARFVAGGLCSGANWAFHAALRDERVQAVLLINPRALIYTEALGPGRDLRALLTQRPSLSKLRRLATGSRLRSFLRWIARTPLRALRRLGGAAPPAAAYENDLDAALGQFADSGKRMMLLFSEHEPLHEELVRSGRMQRLQAAPGVTCERVRIRDHTLRPLWAQAEAHAALDRALERELRRDG
jgi:dienelactone hydrolase